jgi:hypothetical protein
MYEQHEGVSLGPLSSTEDATQSASVEQLPLPGRSTGAVPLDCAAGCDVASLG